MIAADAVAVAVAAGDDDFEFMICHLGAGGHGKSATVQRVHTVGTDVPGEVRRAADAADHHCLMRANTQIRERLL